MNKQEAITRCEEAKQDSNIVVAEFPKEMKCHTCPRIVKYLYVFVDTGISIEVCSHCYGELIKIRKALQE